MSDHPFNEVVKTAHELTQKGIVVFQKFTCDSCGVRQTMETPNTFYRTGMCEECGHVTDIQAKGCNYLAIGHPEDGGNMELLKKILK